MNKKLLMGLVYIYISIVALSAEDVSTTETYSVRLVKGSSMFSAKWQKKVIADYGLKLATTDQYFQRYENDRGDFLTVHDSGRGQNSYHLKYADAQLNGVFDSVTTIQRRFGDHGILGTTIFESSKNCEGTKGDNGSAMLTELGKMWCWNDAVNQRAWIRSVKAKALNARDVYKDIEKSEKIVAYLAECDEDTSVGEINKTLKKILFGK